MSAALLPASLPPWRRLLHELEEAQRRRHAEYVSLINSHKLELAAMLGGGGGQVPRAAQAPRLRAAAGAAAGDPGSHWQPDAQQERQQQQEVRRVQRVERETQLVVMDGGLLESVPEAEDEGESSGMHAPAATPAAKPAARPQPKAAAVTTPAAKAPKKGAAGARGPKSAMMQRVAAAAPAAGRKRGSSDGTEATDPSATTSWPKRRVGRGRRGTTEEGEAAPGAEGMALDEHPKEPRKRRGSTGQAAETKAAPKRARRG